MSDGARADAVYESLLARAGERWVQPRKERTARLLELLDDPQRTYRVVHVTGTNGKTSTSRIVESLLTAYGLRTGLFTSPHLERFTERIRVDGAPAPDVVVADAWDEMAPFVDIVDVELQTAGEEPLTFFELLTVLAFLVFADAPVDVAVIEVGMGGSWDSTNTADGDVAVITPIDLDHADRLGETIGEIAAVKAGIIKPGAAVVSAAQPSLAQEAILARAEDVDASVSFEGPRQGFELVSTRLAVGGQLLTVRGLAATYDDVFLPLYGAHQGYNAALAIAAVEALIGDATQPIPEDVMADGLGEVTSPGRLQLIGTEPTVFVDAAHNPHGAQALAQALAQVFDFEEWGLILGVLDDKDAAGIVRSLAPLATEVFVTSPDSARAEHPDTLADLVEAGGRRASVHRDLEDAAESARAWAVASGAPRRGVIVAGSVILAGEAISLAARDGWKTT